MPDAFIFALLGTLIVFAAALGATSASLADVVDAWGGGFWQLIPFTLQMSLVIITGHVLASSPPIGRLIRTLAGLPATPRGAVAMVTFFALATSWVNWGFSLVFSAVLAREVARRVDGVDYRALAAASFLGLGSIWAQGLSGSAALQMATPGALQPQIRSIVAHGGVVPGGIIPFRHTIFLWQAIVSVVVEVVVVTIVMWLATPPAGKGKTARDLGIDLGPAPGDDSGPAHGPAPTPTSGPARGPAPTPTSGPARGPAPTPTSGPARGPAPTPTSGSARGPAPTPTSGPARGPAPTPTSGPARGPAPTPTSGPARGPAPTATSGPARGPAPTPTSVGADPRVRPAAVGGSTPGQWLEHSRILTWLIVAIGGTFLVRYFARSSEPLNALDINILNLSFLLAGFLMHGTPARLMRAVQDATPAVWGVILQFPFYAGIAGIITTTHLNERLAGVFVRLSTPMTFPPLVAVYSAVLGVFVPSGGSKWVIEAPYVMEAAHTLHTHLGWVVSAYDLGEALANLVQPFWMLPILGMFKLAARDVMGYTLVVFFALVPVVLFLVTVLGLTLRYPL